MGLTSGSGVSNLYQGDWKAIISFWSPPPDLLQQDPVAGGATPARAPRRARRDPDIHSEALGTGFVPIWWQSCVVPAALLLGVVSSQRHLERLQRASRASPVGLGEGFASPGLGPKRLQGRSGIGFCLGRHSGLSSSFLSPPAKIPTARPRVRALRLRAAACRPSGSGRRSGPVAMSNALHGRWSVAPVARLPQQARASVPWVAPQLEAHVQPEQLVRALGGGPLPHAMAQHDCPAPPRHARPTRRGPHPSQAVRLSWPCGTAGGRARGRLRAERIARVEHAETARVRLWAAPHRPAAPGRRVALRTDRRR